MNPPQQVESSIKMPDLQKVSETANDVKKTIGESVGNIGNTMSNVSSSISKTLDDFSSTSSVDAGKEFLEANTIVAKFSFVIIVLIGFLFIMRLGMIVMSYIFSPAQSPYLVKGVLNGNKSKQIKQDPRTENTTIFLSENQQTGLEFSYSIWLNLDGVKNNTTLSHIFNKGMIDITTSFDKIREDTKKPTVANTIRNTYNAPGLYVYRNSSGGNNLRVYMDSYNQTTNISDLSGQAQTVDILDVPLNKWFNVIIRAENRVLDIYVNGVLTKRIDLMSIPRQNFSDVYVNQNGGFIGQLSDLRYFNKSLNVFEINGIVGTGPNLSLADTDNNEVSKNPYYLSSNWYSSNS